MINLLKCLNILKWIPARKPFVSYIAVHCSKQGTTLCAWIINKLYSNPFSSFLSMSILEPLVESNQVTQTCILYQITEIWLESNWIYFLSRLFQVQVNMHLLRWKQFPMLLTFRHFRTLDDHNSKLVYEELKKLWSEFVYDSGRTVLGRPSTLTWPRQ